MENTNLKAGIPISDAIGRKRGSVKFAADACRTFMENEGWTQVFDIAKGTPQRMLVSKKNKLTGAIKTVEIKVTPDLDQRLTAYKFVTSYGYGRPAELAYADDSGRTVTDLLLQALRPDRNNAAGAE